MGEGRLKEDLLRFLRENLKGYGVKSGNLPYRAVVGGDGEPSFSHSRGEGAYQVDVLVSSQRPSAEMPLLAIEVKGGRASSTHDAIIYSQKALAHKAVYPHLRYGFVTRDAKVEARTILHSEGFDFIVALGKRSNAKRLERLLLVIRQQLKTAEGIRAILDSEGKGVASDERWLFPPGLMQ